MDVALEDSEVGEVETDRGDGVGVARHGGETSDMGCEIERGGEGARERDVVGVGCWWCGGGVAEFEREGGCACGGGFLGGGWVFVACHREGEAHLGQLCGRVCS